MEPVEQSLPRGHSAVARCPTALADEVEVHGVDNDAGLRRELAQPRDVEIRHRPERQQRQIEGGPRDQVGEILVSSPGPVSLDQRCIVMHGDALALQRPGVFGVRVDAMQSDEVNVPATLHQEPREIVQPLAAGIAIRLREPVRGDQCPLSPHGRTRPLPRLASAVHAPASKVSGRAGCSASAAACRFRKRS